MPTIDTLALSELVQSDLEDSFAKNPVESLPDLCSQVEEYLLFHLVPRWILDTLSQYAAETKTRFSTDGASHLTLGDAGYVLRVVPHAIRPQVLQVALWHVTEPRLTRRWLRARIDSAGRCNQLWLRLDEKVSQTEQVMADTITAVIGAGYRWLAAYVLSYLDAIRSDAAKELYTALRTWLPPSVVDNVWLSAFVEKASGIMVAMYIPDARAELIALDRTRRRDVRDDRSPLDQLAQFETDLTDFERTFSYEAITSNELISREFAAAGYAASGIQIAEQAIYQATMHTIQPLVREGKSLLIAAYPAGLQSVVAPILERKREQVKSIVQRRADSLFVTVKKLANRGVLPELHAKWFEYAGAFLRGCVGDSA